jgi:hypothetical protein
MVVCRQSLADAVPPRPARRDRNDKQAGFHQYLFAVERIDRMIGQLRIGENAMRKDAYGGCVHEKVKHLPSPPSQRSPKIRSHDDNHEDIQARRAECVFNRLDGRPCRTDAPLIYRSLAAIEERLNPTMFFRANRSQIVNLRWIESVQTEIDGRLVVHLAKDKRVEISRRQSRKLKELLSL